ncbi:3-isopropylmalate dehydratase [Chloroflexota bacterium]
MSKIRELQGRSWVFGDLMDVDWEICAFDVYQQLKGQNIPITEEAVGKYCMINVDPDFPNKVKKGDFIVAGENFGYGHDHDHACIALKGAGVAAVLCESTNANFMRNSIHHALPVIVCRGIQKKVKEGDELKIDLKAGTIVNLSTNEEMRFVPPPDFLLEIIGAGGLYPHLEKQIREGRV